ncbi:MAG: HDOD domain-containing protein [Oceanipulchritudo sp.]
MHLDTLISEVSDIPPAPQVLPRLQAILRDPDSDMTDVVAFLKVDVSLSTTVLRFANSSYFAGSTSADGLEEAIQRIGFREINRLVSMASSKGILDRALPVYNAKEGELFETSLACAQIMHALGGALEPGKTDSYYTTGLLHGIGKIVINQYFKSHGLSLYGGHDGTTESMEEISPDFENRVLGFNHADAGATLLAKWQFSPEITEPIRFQHRPAEAPVLPARAHCLHLANAAAPVFREAGGSFPDSPLPSGADEAPGLDPESLQALLETAFAEFQDLRRMLAG